ncbi:hypothetical protein OH77DRAFT_1439735 [Trametes cingulata]|nr:hypothetical protein OH77DRAFT_1439735 [Trametes cingulata]
MRCEICSYEPGPNEYIPAATTRKFAAGDICRIAESVRVPFLLLFQQTRRELATGKVASQSTMHTSAGGTSQSQSTFDSPTASRTSINPRQNKAIDRSLLSIQSRETAAYLRPCVLLAGHRPGRNAHPRVCLCATFGRKAMESLPRAFQCFCVPIFPNTGMEGTSADGHLHAFPEWPGDKAAWLIAYPFVSKRQVDDRWYHRNESGTFSDQKCSRLDSTQRGKLEKIRESLLDDWRVQCETPGFLDACETEFLSNEWRKHEGWNKPADSAAGSEQHGSDQLSSTQT